MPETALSQNGQANGPASRHLPDFSPKTRNNDTEGNMRLGIFLPRFALGSLLPIGCGVGSGSGIEVIL